MSDAPVLRALGQPSRSEVETVRLDRERHEANQQALLRFRLTEWGVGPLERRVVLGGVADRTPLRLVLRFHQERLQSLVLCGASQAGKSVAAAYWLTLAGRRRVETAALGQSWVWDNSCRFISAFDLEQAQGSFDRAHRALLQEAIDAKALVLDDLGAELVSVKATLTRILYERNRYQRRTVITTNLDEKTFAQRYDQRNVERIRQSGRFVGCGAEAQKGEKP